MSFLTGIRESINRWLRQCAKDNHRQFGQSAPDCCKLLNRKKGATT